jgi:hypothetical protein
MHCRHELRAAHAAEALDDLLVEPVVTAELLRGAVSREAV